MDANTLTELPVFPLPDVVLMPGGVLPLHIFEPRYRAMLAHVRDGDGLIAMGTLLPTGQVHPTAGVGQLVDCQVMPDGRANIVLRHVGTVQLEDELPLFQGFRRFRAVERTVAGVDQLDLDAVRALVVQASAVVSAPSELVEALLRLPGVQLVHGVAPFLFRTTASRLTYLDADDPERVEMISEALALLLSAGDPVGEA